MAALPAAPAAVAAPSPSAEFTVNEEPEIEEAEVTSLVPDSARSGDLLVVREAATGRQSFYKVIETRDLGSAVNEALKGAASGAATGAAIVRTTGDDGGAALLKVSAGVAGAIFGVIGGVVTGGYDLIFNPDKSIVLVNGDQFIDTAVNAGQVHHLRGHYVEGTGVVPLDQSFQP